MCHIVFITQRPLTERDRQRFSIVEMERCNISVSVFDVSNLLYEQEELYNENYHVGNTLVYRITNVSAINDVFENNAFTHAIFVGYTSFRIYKIIRNLFNHVSVLQLGPVPVLSRKYSIIDRFKMLNFKRIKNKIISFYFKYYLSKNKIDVLFYAGKDTPKLTCKKEFFKKSIACHSYDYYLNLMDNSSEKIVSKEHIVFLDQMLPLHSDFKILFGIESIEYDNYYRKLNDFFSFIESRFNLPVVVAAHPRVSELDFEYSRLFPGRKVFLGKTNELIKSSYFCITHYSASTNYAVIHNKPLLLCTGKELKKLGVDENVNLLSKELKAKVFDLDKSYEDIDINSIFSCLDYSNYIFKYMTTIPDDYSFNGEIILKELMVNNY